MKKYPKNFTKEKNTQSNEPINPIYQPPSMDVNPNNQYQYMPQNMGFPIPNPQYAYQPPQPPNSIFDFPSVKANPVNNAYDPNPNPYQAINAGTPYATSQTPPFAPPPNMPFNPPQNQKNYQQNQKYHQQNQKNIQQNKKNIQQNLRDPPQNPKNHQQNQKNPQKNIIKPKPPVVIKPEQKKKKPYPNPKHILSPEELTLKKIADENYDIVKSHKYQITNSQTITEEDHISILSHLGPPRHKLQKTTIIVNQLSTISTAIQMHDKYKNHKICLLSFSDPFKPGGGYLKGRIGQEESICRQTLLFPTLCESNMYKINKENVKSITQYDTMIFSPDVYIIRDDDFNLLEKKSFTVDVISSPPVDNRNNFQNSAIIMERRIRRIVFLAANKGAEILILGAFGCGILKNDPSFISQIFKKILVAEGLKNYFKVVVFPIYKNDGNYVIFNNTLGKP